MDRPAVPLLPRPVRVAGAAAVALAILFASVVDPPTTGASPVILGVSKDKWLHALAYAGLASSLAYAGLPETDVPERRAVAAAFLLAVGYGVGIELVQSTLPYRAFDLLDVLSNAVGATVGVVPWLGVRAR